MFCLATKVSLISPQSTASFEAAAFISKDKMAIPVSGLELTNTGK